MNKRFDEIDLTKGVMIFLMVCFHIKYEGILKSEIDYLTIFIYSFHMPVFLLYSGYFININNRLSKNIYSVFRHIFLPYIIFEFIYIVCLYAASKLGFSFSNKIDTLYLSVILEKLFISPIGAYWYLHTLCISLVIIYIISYFFTENLMTQIIIIGLLFYFLTFFISGFRFENALFILIGFYFKSSNQSIKSSLLSLIPIIVIFYSTIPDLKRGSIASLGITVMIISFLNALYLKYSKNFLSRWFIYLGRNTLIILLVHPIFLNFSRISLPIFLKIDKTGISYLVITTIVTLMSSLATAYCTDTLKISNFIFGKNLYIHFRQIN